MKLIKKIMPLFLLCLAVTACGKSVIIEFPSRFFEGEDAQEIADYLSSSDGIKIMTVNDDGSATLTVTEEKYQLILDNMEETISSMYDTIGGEDSFFQTVKSLDCDENYTTLTFTVDREAYEASSESTSVEQVIYLARLYQVYHLSDSDITVHYIDEETGEIYRTEVYNLNGETVS